MVGISTDDVDTLRRFRERLETPFELLSDDGGKVSKEYGGTMMGMSKRATYVVGQDGRIVHITTGNDAIDPAGDAESCPVRK